ncbi:hypothetical protein TTHERM_00582240 (macronuclear) [Tetrahymena thermophila SB210]|uniref:Leucine Rich Repeat family protein n=1 Tax=Tetrahymena thermophila (strain SB210) TaxID=312017 RepID=Q23Q66_TETTS|nr:hypothetical protein TTHERM_00582240 [Tetrahymena thermophila SB210]EAR98718.2 hypothetical protein TTHERM_00582240 [Tetrahymena thermophila SB210]|eukprot:XP_001018963.2 hypothetical protein TTHERM_00582240 [Tetrahymena thermophila SB210]
MSQKKVKKVKYNVKNNKNSKNGSDSSQISDLLLINNINLTNANNNTETTAETFNFTKQETSILPNINNNAKESETNSQKKFNKILLDISITSNSPSQLQNQNNQTNQQNDASLANELKIEQIFTSTTINNEVSLPQIEKSQRQQSIKKYDKQIQELDQSREKLLYKSKVTAANTSQNFFFNTFLNSIREEDAQFEQKQQEEELQLKERKQVELANLFSDPDSNLKTQFKVDQAIKILEQAASKYYHKDNVKQVEVKQVFYMKRNARSSSPKLKKLLPHQLQQIKTKNFLNSIQEIQPSQEFIKSEDNKIQKFNNEPKLTSIKKQVQDQQTNSRQNYFISSKENSSSQSNRIVNFNDDSLYYFKKMIISKKELKTQKSDDNIIDRKISSSPSNNKQHTNNNKIPKIKMLAPLPIKITFTDKKDNDLPSPNEQPQQENYKNEFEFAMSEAAKQMINRPVLHKVNRLREKKIIDLIQELTQNDKEVNLSDNNLTSICLDLLMNKFNSLQVNLEVLKLSNVGITDDSISIISCALQLNQPLIVLDLSKNSITNIGCLEIKFIIQSNINLKELYLSWNKFNSDGASQILDSIQAKNSLKVLDLSNNSLGNGTQASIRKFLISFDRLMKLEQEDGLVHLDLRVNQIKKEQLIEMARSIQYNQSIPCIHLSYGHECYMDSCNNLKIYSQDQQVQLPEYSEFLPIYPINYKRPFRAKKNNLFENFVMAESENCWICEGWIEHEFELNLNVYNLLNFYREEQNLYLHLEIDEFVPCKMLQSQIQQGMFSIQRMIPPQTSLKYYFSFDGRTDIILSQETEIIKGNFIQAMNIQNQNDKASEQLEEQNQNNNLRDFMKIENGILLMNQFNLIKTGDPQPYLNQQYQTLVSSLPRQNIFLQQKDSREEILLKELEQSQLILEKNKSNRISKKIVKIKN